jgi:hypothetical protein
MICSRRISVPLAAAHTRRREALQRIQSVTLDAGS